VDLGDRVQKNGISADERAQYQLRQEKAKVEYLKNARNFHEMAQNFQRPLLIRRH
jgi:hypothetical protein